MRLDLSLNALALLLNPSLFRSNPCPPSRSLFPSLTRVLTHFPAILLSRSIALQSFSLLRSFSDLKGSQSSPVSRPRYRGCLCVLFLSVLCPSPPPPLFCYCPVFSLSPLLSFFFLSLSLSFTHTHSVQTCTQILVAMNSILPFSYGKKSATKVLFCKQNAIWEVAQPSLKLRSLRNLSLSSKSSKYTQCLYPRQQRCVHNAWRCRQCCHHRCFPPVPTQSPRT